MDCVEEEVGEVMRMNFVVVLWEKPSAGAFGNDNGSKYVQSVGQTACPLQTSVASLAMD